MQTTLTSRMSEKPVYTLKCTLNCELKSILVYAKAISRLQGKDQCLTQRWLCDEVGLCNITVNTCSAFMSNVNILLVVC